MPMNIGWQLREKLSDVERSIILGQRTEAIEHKLTTLEIQVRQTAEACKSSGQWMKSKMTLAIELQALIARRRSMQAKSGEAQDNGATLGKQIQKHIRKDICKHKRDRIAEEVTAFRDLKTSRGIKKRDKKRNLISV